MEYYDIWRECTFIYSNQNVKICLFIAVFIVPLLGGQVDNSHPGGDVLYNIIQSP